jgi:hypothetical protein
MGMRVERKLNNGTDICRSRSRIARWYIKGRVVMLEFNNVNIGITDALNECQQVQL